MAYIFMDESGDLGFDKSKARSSKNFLITFFFCDNTYSGVSPSTHCGEELNLSNK